MSEMKDGGHAFPNITEIMAAHTIDHQSPKWSKVKSSGGMTLRDWFAGQAPDVPEYFKEFWSLKNPPPRMRYNYGNPDHDGSDRRYDATQRCLWTVRMRGEWAYFYADAMIEARK